VEEYTEAVLVKVNKSTKKRMKDKKINWSAEIRKFIDERLKTKKDKNLALAVALTDKIFRKAKKGSFNSTEFIRKMRETRHGATSN